MGDRVRCHVREDTASTRAHSAPYATRAHPAASATAGAARAPARARPMPRSARRLYHAEQVMEERKLPKKKYLATQRLRRDLERSSVESLKLDVNFLRQEIVNLRTVREIVQAQRLTTRVDAASSLMGMVAQYHTMTKHGIGREAPRAALSARDKIAFLHSIVDAHVRVGSTPVRGRDAFIQQWLAYTLFHAHVCVDAPKLHELQSSDASSELPIIVSTSRVRVRVSRQTLAVMFPHTLADEVLVQQLIGCELTYPCETRFYFSRARMIVRHDTEVDFVSGLNDVLQSLRQVNAIMDHARLDGCSMVLDSSTGERLQRMAEDMHCGIVATLPADDAASVPTDQQERHSAAAAAAADDLDETQRPVASRMSIDMLLS